MKNRRPATFVLYWLLSLTATMGVAFGQEGEATKSVDQWIDGLLAPLAKFAVAIIFFSVKIGGQDVPIVLILLGGTAVILTLLFGFINLRAFRLALKTIRGKYSSKSDPGEITHFQALTAALSATVGLGNIAGVAIAIGIGGPGAVFWMVMMGLCGMTTKFCECTLGTKFRRISPEGKVSGGAMYYLEDGVGARGGGWKVFGKILAVMFAILCICGAFGAGNMYQANQAHAQFSTTFGILENGWMFGAIMAVVVGLVIVGGIVWIGRVTSILVPFMCGSYVIAALVIIFSNLGAVPDAFEQIVLGAFREEALTGGLIGALIQGIRRAAFSNEAGIGSAPIAHSAVKTTKPASEGIVALLEPFVDTVVVCTMTALVIVIGNTWKISYQVDEAQAIELRSDAIGDAEVLHTVSAEEYLRELGTKQEILVKASEEAEEESRNWIQVRVLADGGETDTEIEGWMAADATEADGGVTKLKGIPVTSLAFEKGISWFPVLLTVAVLLFAFSTMISWSYYGEQGVIYLFGRKRGAIIAYNLVFCAFIVIGAGASLSNVIDLSDAAVFGMCIPNLIGVYLLLPVIRKELKIFRSHAKTIDEGASDS
jgi:AGCS family alanine or glycine:cation symporter